MGHSSGNLLLCTPAVLSPSTPWQWFAAKLLRAQPMIWNQVQPCCLCILGIIFKRLLSQLFQLGYFTLGHGL